MTKEHSTRVLVVGDGPAGLSAALLLAKAGQGVTVMGAGETGVKSALLLNYLGLPEMLGTEFYAIATAQVRSHGGLIMEDAAASATAHDGIAVKTSAGEELRADYLILAEGRRKLLAKQLGLVDDNDRVEVDSEFRTTLDRVYLVGRSLRPKRSQAIISAGAGATAALDILSRESGTDFHDWDVPD